MIQSSIRSALYVLLAGAFSTLLAANASAQTSLLVGPTALEFSVPDGASQPPPQQVLVASDGANLNFEARSTSKWLFLSQTWGVSPATLTVTVDATGLPGGLYQDVISVNSGLPTHASVSVTLRVGGSSTARGAATAASTRPLAKTLRAMPEGFTFLAKSGAGAPAPQSLFVPRSPQEDGAAATSSAAWLAVSPAKTSSSPGFQEMQLSANPEGLAPGQYTAAVALRSRAGGEKTIPVTFNVGDDTHLVAERSLVSFRAQPGGAMPAPQTVVIRSTGANLKFTASTTSGSWLAVGPQTGSTDGANTITVAVNPASLPTGVTTGSITVTAAGAMEPLTIPVVLTTSQATGISIGGQVNIQPVFTGSLGGGLQSMNFALTSTINGETFATQSGNSGWLALTPGTGSVPAMLTLTADPNLAGLGTHTAQAFAAGGAGTDQVNFFVTFTVSAGNASTITASPSSLTFAYTVGGAVPPAQTVTLSSPTSNTFTAQTDSSYVNVSPAAGTSTSSGTTLSVTVSPTGLGSTPPTSFITITGGLTNFTIPVTINITNNTPACSLVNGVSTLNFMSFQGQGAPPSQTVQLNCNFATTFTAAANQTFDSVSPASGSVTANTPVTLTVAVTPGALVPKTYQDLITITPAGVSSPITLQILYTISSAATITPTPSSLSYTQVAGGTAPANQTVMLTSGTPTTFSVMSSASFLSTDVSSGTTPQTLTVKVNGAGLVAGTYQGTLTITGGAAAVTVTVTLTVTPSSTTATIVATPSSLSFAINSGVLPNPQTTQLTTSPAGMATAFTITSNVGWLDITPTSGTTDQLLTVSVNSTSSGLGFGTFMGTITISGGAATTTIPVTLSIPNPNSNAITPSPSTLTFNAVLGGSAPPSQTVTLTSTPAVAFTAASSQPTWLLVTPTSGTTGANNLTVSVVPAGLGAGTYTANIAVTPTGSGSGGIVSIPVTLVITASPVITAAPTSLNFTQILSTGVLPAAQSVNLTAGTTTAFTAGGTQTWLMVSPTTGNTNATLTVSVNGSSLSPGNYTDTITVTGGASPVTIAVNFTVLAGSDNAIVPNPLAVVFTQSLGDTAFQNKLVMLSANSPTGFSATSDSSWLMVSPATGTTPATLALTESAVGLSLGTYMGNITVTGGVATVTIPVMLTISVAPNAIVPTPSSASFSQFLAGTAPGSQTIQLTSTNPTAFTLTNGQSWLTVTPTSGTTNTTLTLSVNPFGLLAGTYQDSIIITGGAFTVAIPVTYTINPDTFLASPSSLSFTQTLGGAAPASQTVQVTSGVAHTYNASVNQPWLSVTPAMGTSPAALTVSVNGAGLAVGTYNGIITLNGDGSPVTVPVTLTIAVATGAVFAPSTVTFSAAAGAQTPLTQTVTVSSSAAQFSFAASATVSNNGSGTGNWLSVSPATGTTPATLTLTANPAGLASGQYAGILTITPTDGSIPTQNLAVTLSIAGSTSTAFVRSVQSAASFQPGPVSPGELISLFGLGLGPNSGVGATALASGAIPTTLAGTQVFFDGVAAPMLYAQAGQVNCIVPYNVYGRTTTSMQVSISGVLAAPIGIAVQNTAPAVFTVSGTGTGQSSVINQDGTINGPNFPAPAGSVIAIYGTGEGQTNSPGQDGRIISTDLRHPIAASTAQVGTLGAQITYIGSAPTLVSGVFQMNVMIPAGLTPGQQPLQLTIGGVTTQAGITVAVK